MGRLEGKVALISGGARGQGAAEARLFAQEGARVVVGDILDAAGKQVEEAIRAQGGEATYVHLDVTHEADWVEAVGTAVNRYGKLDILVNNAGIVLRKDIEDTTEADWDRIMAVNAKGVFLGTKHAIPAMRRAGGGSIVNISSISGLVAIGPPAHIPSDLVVDHRTSSVESSLPLDFLSLHAMWTPFGGLMSCKIMSIISVCCDFTTKSGGIWKLLLEIAREIGLTPAGYPL